MRRFVVAWLPFLALTAAVMLFSGEAQAYVGPGMGLGVIAVVVGVVASVFVAIFAIFWYPIKRLLKRRKAQAAAQQPLSQD
jgi:hypothetical protein